MLDIFDKISLAVFLLEIALKWLDDFQGYFGDAWNVFDLLVTIGVRFLLLLLLMDRLPRHSHI